MDAIRRRENSTLVAASKAEATLSAAEDKLADLVASQEEAITDARVAVGRAYLDVIDAFGSRSRAAEYLGITRHQLKKAVAAVPAETPTEAVRSTAPAPGSGS